MDGYVHTHAHIYIYICMYRQREKERSSGPLQKKFSPAAVTKYMCIKLTVAVIFSFFLYKIVMKFVTNLKNLLIYSLIFP